MSRITDYILEPKVVYTEGGFLVRVKVIDDYKYKKYIVSENLHYKTVQGTSFTLTDAEANKQASILQLEGNTSQNGTPTPSSPVEVKTVSGDNEVVVSNKNLAWTGWAEDFVTRVNAPNNCKTETFDNKNCLYWTASVGYGSYDTKYMFKTNWKTNTQYTISCKIYRSGTYSNLCIEYTDGTVQEFVNGTATTWESISLTSTANKTIKYIRPYYRSGNAYIDIDTFQCEQGTQATEYIAHQGNSYRVDLGGKNLFNKNDVENNKRLDSAGQPTSASASGFSLTNYIKVEPNTKYTLSRNTTSSTYYVNISEYTSDKTHIQRLYCEGNTTTTYTFTTPNNCEYLRINDATSNLDNIQLEKGSQATPYSPYTDNPIELCKIGNYQDKLLQSKGNNLFNENVYNDTSLYAIQSLYFAYVKMPDSFKRKFYGNMVLTGTNQNLVFGFSDSHIGINTRILNNGTLNRNVLYDFTNAENVYLIIGNSQYVNIARDIPLIYNNYKIMISENANEPYEPYGVGKWYIEKQVGKVVLNGTETGWKNDSTNKLSGLTVSDAKSIVSPTVINALCSHYKAYSLVGSRTNTDGFSGNATDIWFNNNSMTLANFKTWVSNNNLTVYYTLATPTYTEITDTYLLEQLNNILDIELYESLCYVDFIGIEKPTMNLQYAGTEDLGIKYIITEDGKKIRTDWRKLGRRKNGR